MRPVELSLHINFLPFYINCYIDVTILQYFIKWFVDKICSIKTCSNMYLVYDYEMANLINMLDHVVSNKLYSHKYIETLRAVEPDQF